MQPVEVICRKCKNTIGVVDVDTLPERTNEPTCSPQQPVVQQSATFDSEQTGVVVQGSTDEPDRKDLSVQQLAGRLDELLHWVGSEYDIACRQSKSSTTLGKHKLAQIHDAYARAMTKVYARLSEAIQESKQAQVEHEAKRAAADC